jgi:uncharacterized membrane protein
MAADLTTHETEPRIAPRSARRSQAPRGSRALADRGGNSSDVDGDARGQRLARALGWFSIGLGLAEVVAPRGVARLIGASDDDTTRNLLRTMGLREIAAGVGILSQRQPTTWMWSRVAGDALDLALLGAAMKSDDASRTRLLSASAAVLGVTALDIYAGTQLRRSEDGESAEETDRAIHLKTAVTVNKPVEEVYRFWRDFNNLPRFMHHLEAVRITGPRTSHWKAKAPIGMTVEWDAEIIEDTPNESIVWRSLEGADVDNSGAVRFKPAPGDRGTEIILEMNFRPPGGVIGAKLGKIFDAVPRTQMKNDLRRFKQVLELGEVIHSDDSIIKGPTPARPATEALSS